MFRNYFLLSVFITLLPLYGMDDMEWEYFNMKIMLVDEISNECAEKIEDSFALSFTSAMREETGERVFEIIHHPFFIKGIDILKYRPHYSQTIIMESIKNRETSHQDKTK